jgi:hypothetical protein
MITYRIDLTMEAHVLFHVVNDPKGAPTSCSIWLFFVPDRLVITKTLSHTSSFRDQNFIDLEAACVHGEN